MADVDSWNPLLWYIALIVAVILPKPARRMLGNVNNAQTVDYTEFGAIVRLWHEGILLQRSDIMDI
jgi:hypothetical protein